MAFSLRGNAVLSGHDLITEISQIDPHLIVRNVILAVPTGVAADSQKDAAANQTRLRRTRGSIQFAELFTTLMC